MLGILTDKQRYVLDETLFRSYTSWEFPGFWLDLGEDAIYLYASFCWCRLPQESGDCYDTIVIGDHVIEELSDRWEATVYCKTIPTAVLIRLCGYKPFHLVVNGLVEDQRTLLRRCQWRERGRYWRVELAGTELRRVNEA